MNKYRRFKYPFGGTGYVDSSNPTPDLQTILAYQDNLPVAKNTGGVQPINEPRQYLQEYTERVRPEVERKVNEMNRRPSGNGRIIRNHDKLYDYYKDGDKLYYRKKGGKNWIDISDNELAQKRINATIARNKRTYGKPKTSSDEYTPEELRAQGFVQNNKGYWVRPEDLKESEETPKTVNTSAPKRVQGASKYKKSAISSNSDYNKRNSIFGDKYANKTPNNQSRYSNVPSDYLLTALNPGAQSYDRITHNVNKMRRNQVQIPEAKIKDWGFYFNRQYQSQPTGARGAVVTTAPSKWRGKY